MLVLYRTGKTPYISARAALLGELFKTSAPHSNLGPGRSPHLGRLSRLDPVSKKLARFVIMITDRSVWNHCQRRGIFVQRRKRCSSSPQAQC
jgi:hypothetical protein